LGCTEDGEEMKMDLEKMKIGDVLERVERHSRMLARKEDLAG
jgi:large subunit ribosomal protein L53